MDNSKEDKKKRKETNSNDDSLDKSKKLKKIKKEPSKTKIQKSTSVFKPTTQPNTNLNICSLCNIKESKLYEMKCTSNHSICFKCLYDFFLININEIINDKSNKNNKKITIIKCPKCFNIDNSGGVEFKNTDLLSLIQEHIKKGFSQEYSKTLKPCSDHDNPLDFYCDTCDNYICKLCCKYEHDGHKSCLIKEKNDEIINMISKKSLKIKDTKDFIKKIENINNTNKKLFNCMH